MIDELLLVNFIGNLSPIKSGEEKGYPLAKTFKRFFINIDPCFSDFALDGICVFAFSAITSQRANQRWTDIDAYSSFKEQRSDLYENQDQYV